LLCNRVASIFTMDEFIPSHAPMKEISGPAWWFGCSGSQLLVKADTQTPAIPFAMNLEALGLDVECYQYLGTLNGHPCCAAALAGKNPLPPEWVFRDLRTLFGRLGEVSFAVAERAVHLAQWDRSTRYCSQCGQTLRFRQDVRAKECPECKRLDFPRISPAIIVLIERDGKVLLARSPRFVEPFYSVLAGFVEPGENLEEAVLREVKEEVGITVEEVRYFGSQPWPFPDSLMIGFTARYAGGEIRIDNEEIVAADWFDAENLPRIPGRLSIARRLIEWFLSTQKNDPGRIN